VPQTAFFLAQLLFVVFVLIVGTALAIAFKLRSIGELRASGL
jgi:hypothetical protein